MLFFKKNHSSPWRCRETGFYMTVMTKNETSQFIDKCFFNFLDLLTNKKVTIEELKEMANFSMKHALSMVKQVEQDIDY